MRTCVDPLGVLVGLLISFATVGCRQTTHLPSTQVLVGQTMGTTYSIKFAPHDDLPELAEISKQVQAELDRVNSQMSTYQADSELSQFNRSSSGDWFSVSAETAAVVQRAIEIGRLTDGAFDVTVGPLVDLWGFGPAARPDKIPSSDQIAEAQQWTGIDKVEVRGAPPAIRKIDPQVRIDLSAIAKGHGVDRIAAKLDQLGIQDYFIEIGGEVRARGTRIDGQQWRVGVEHADERQRSILIALELSNQALATSGNYRNFYEVEGERVSHTIDPRSGWPVAHTLASASVIAEDCATADAVATAMMVVGLQLGLELAEKYDWAVLLVPSEAAQRVPAEEALAAAVASSRFKQQFPDLAGQLANPSEAAPQPNR